MTAVFNETDKPASVPTELLHHQQVINFIHDTHSYEFFKGQQQDDRLLFKSSPSTSAAQRTKEQRLGVGVNNLVQQLNMFYQDFDEDEITSAQ